MNKETKSTVLNLLDELYEKRAETSMSRIQDNLSISEIRVIEGEFDSYFKRTINKIENLINLD